MSPGNISDKELTDFLLALERGEITLKPDLDPASVYCGNVPYTASNGWSITIFNDCDEWDYIDSVQSADGSRLDYADIKIEYDPSDEVVVRVYRISIS